MLGLLGVNGKDKVTIISSPGISGLGTWLEQLIAESIGKESRALIPVDRENTASPDVYSDDRTFVYLRLGTAFDALQDERVDGLASAGRPVIRIPVDDPYHLGQEFFRWEVATAVAGSIYGINPFDQPDVEASKVASRALTDEYEKVGSLPQESPMFEADGIQLYTDEKNRTALEAVVGESRSLPEHLRAHLARIERGDYFALLAFCEMSEDIEESLQRIRHMVRDGKRTATCLGFGPRFLHSTGQAYKGGPNTGVFLQVTCEDTIDLSIPGRKYTFGVVKAAQQRGDFEVLTDRDRRALRVHLGEDVRSGLEVLVGAVKEAL
jgi:transaldolase/glucose-6-phosphate isomerase